MKAVLLAAGEGTRLHPLTLDRPKPMVEIAGRPAIAYELEWLRANGVAEVAINLHYRPEPLRAFVGDGSAFGLRVMYSVEEPDILGTAGALAPLRAWLEGEDVFVVLYGDVLTVVDLAPAIAAHTAANADVTIVLNRGDDPSRSGVVEFDEGMSITRFVEKPPPDQVFSDWVNSGVYLCGPRTLDFVVRDGFQDFARDVFPAMLAVGCRLRAHPTTSTVLEFGSLERVAAAESQVRCGALAGDRLGPTAGGRPTPAPAECQTGLLEGS